MILQLENIATLTAQSPQADLAKYTHIRLFQNANVFIQRFGQNPNDLSEIFARLTAVFKIGIDLQFFADCTEDEARIFTAAIKCLPALKEIEFNYYAPLDASRNWLLTSTPERAQSALLPINELCGYLRSVQQESNQGQSYRIQIGEIPKILFNLALNEQTRDQLFEIFALCAPLLQEIEFSDASLDQPGHYELLERVITVIPHCTSLETMHFEFDRIGEDIPEDLIARALNSIFACRTITSLNFGVKDFNDADLVAFCALLVALPHISKLYIRDLNLAAYNERTIVVLGLTLSQLRRLECLNFYLLQLQPLNHMQALALQTWENSLAQHYALKKIECTVSATEPTNQVHAKLMAKVFSKCPRLVCIKIAANAYDEFPNPAETGLAVGMLILECKNAQSITIDSDINTTDNDETTFYNHLAHFLTLYLPKNGIFRKMSFGTFGSDSTIPAYFADLFRSNSRIVKEIPRQGELDGTDRLALRNMVQMRREYATSFACLQHSGVPPHVITNRVLPLIFGPYLNRGIVDSLLKKTPAQFAAMSAQRIIPEPARFRRVMLDDRHNPRVMINRIVAEEKRARTAPPAP